MVPTRIGVGELRGTALAVVPFLTIALLDGPSTEPLASELKCGLQPEGTTALIAIDGVIQGALPEGDQRFDLSSDDDKPLNGRVDREDLFWVQVVCMDPRDSTFRRGGSGVGVISVWTKDGPAGQMTPALSEIVEAQERHFEHEGRYLEDLSAIDGFAAPERVEIELQTEPDWWIATARTERFLGQCTARGGTGGGVSSEPECADDR